MRSSVPFLTLSLAALTNAQGNLAAVLQSQPDLSTLLDLVVLANLTDTLSTASNITIVAPTNDAFEELLKLDIPESVAIKERDAVTVAALLRNHVFQGYYPSSEIGAIPTFVQSLVMPDEQNAIQPFTAITGGQYNGLIRTQDGVAILSSEFTVSTVTQADIRVGSSIIVHKIDKALSFGVPLTIFTARYGYTNFNAALVASGLKLFSGIEITSASESPTTDVTIFIPQDQALEAIGSVLAGADIATIQEVLKYHVVEHNILFSPQLTNTSITSIQGGELVITVEGDGSIFVNNAKVVLPNAILYEGVAHIIDSVLNPLIPFSRFKVEPNAPASDRVQFEGATSTSQLPFTSVTFASEVTFAYSLDPLFTTAPAISPLGSVSATPIASIPATSMTRAASAASASSTGPAQFMGASSVKRPTEMAIIGAVLIAGLSLVMVL